MTGRAGAAAALAGSALLAMMVGCAPLPLAATGAPPSGYGPPVGAAQVPPRQAPADVQACEARLAAMGLSFTPVADRSEGGFCRVTGAVVLHDRPDQPDARLSPADPMMACPLAAEVARWRREEVEPAAREILGADVRQIDHLGVYACRNVNNQVGGRPSAHARAAAIDVAGFRLSDGREITVAGDWQGDTPAARFLHRIRDRACGVFGTTLSPDYNALHSDHLHLEAGPGRFCR